MAGIASLFTREFFTAARARLAPGGVLCQWAHTYDISAEDLRSIVATFAAVFPDGTIWLVGDGDVLLIGGTEPMGPRVAALAEVWNRRPEAVADLAGVGARDPFGMLSLLVAEGQGLARFAAGAPLLTDDYARVEFSGPRTVFSRNASDNAAALAGLGGRTHGPGGRGGPGHRLRRFVARPRLDAAGGDRASRPPGPTSRARCAATRGTRGRSRAWCVPAPPPSVAPRPSRCCASWRHRPTTSRRNSPCRASWPRPGRSRRPRPRRSRSPNGTPRMSPRSNSWPRSCPMSGTRTGCCRWFPGCARLRRPRTRRATTRRRCSSSTGAPARPSPRPGCWWPTVRSRPRPQPAWRRPGHAGRREDARDAFLASLKVEPRDPSTYTNLGLLELESRQPHRRPAAAGRGVDARPERRSGPRGLRPGIVARHLALTSRSAIQNDEARSTPTSPRRVRAAAGCRAKTGRVDHLRQKSIRREGRLAQFTLICHRSSAVRNLLGVDAQEKDG